MAEEFSIRTFSNDDALVKERRTHIARSSTKLFTKKGYERTNMREVAKACAMSPGALYHYLGSKEEILYLIIRNATLEQAEHVEKIGANLESMAPPQALGQLIKDFFEWHNRNQDITLFIYQDTRSLPANARQQIFHSEDRIQAVFERLLRKGMDSGAFAIEDPGLIAHDIVVLGHAWALRRWFVRKHWSFDEYLSRQTDFILKILEPKTNRD